MGANTCKCLDQKNTDDVHPSIRHSRKGSKMNKEKGNLLIFDFQVSSVKWNIMKV